eukprot:gene21531-37273_t
MTSPELEDWVADDGSEIEEKLRFYRGATIVTLREIDLKPAAPEEGDEGGQIDEGQKGTVVKVPGDTPGSVAQVAFLLDGDARFDAMPGDVELFLQEPRDPWRTTRMVVVVALIFEPISFTWCRRHAHHRASRTSSQQRVIVPGHAGQLTAKQMTDKIIWDVLLYGTMVVTVNITNNAVLQTCDAAIKKENERRGGRGNGFTGGPE